MISRTPRPPVPVGRAVHAAALRVPARRPDPAGDGLAPAAAARRRRHVGGRGAAPALDRPAPWIDYEHLAEDVASRGTVGYSWDHSYGPLDWPRDGRELLRIKAQAQAYWKAEVLDTFDGARLAAAPAASPRSSPTASRTARSRSGSRRSA